MKEFFSEFGGMISKESVGVEISNTHLTIAHAKATPFDTEICAQAVHDLGGAGRFAEKIDTIIATVKDFWRQHRIGDACIWIGLPAEMVFQRVISLPWAAKENIGKALEYELQKYMPLELEDIYIGHQILNEDRAERRLKILVAAVKKKDVAPLIEQRNHLGTGICGLESVATAGINGLRWAGKSIFEKAYGLAYVAGSTLHLSYFEGDQIQFIRSLDLHGDLTYQLAQIFQESEHTTTPRSESDSPAHLKVYFHGPDASEDMLQTLNNLPNLEFSHLDLTESPLQEGNQVVSAGLALKSLQPVPLDINLFPRQFRKKPSFLGRYLTLALAVLMLITGMAWAGSSYIRPRIVTMRLDRELNELSDEIKALEQVQGKITSLQARIDYLNNLRQKEIHLLDFLRELTEIVPDTAWLLGLSIADNKVEIQGTASYSTELISQLEASPLFANAKFISTITKGRDDKEVFKIGFEISRQ
jgi:Tfp pilus assembly protein PilN